MYVKGWSGLECLPEVLGLKSDVGVALSSLMWDGLCMWKSGYGVYGRGAMALSGWGDEAGLVDSI